jgi:hypothetical protein
MRMGIPARQAIVQSGSTGARSTPRRNGRFRLQSDVKNSGHGSGPPSSRSHRAGDTVRQSGIYEVIHDRGHRDAHEVVMISGERFPDCETCKEKVRFRLVRTAPYIFQDEDFEEDL